jgi:hypothetical protein
MSRSWVHGHECLFGYLINQQFQSQSAILSNIYQFVILFVKVSYEYELSKNVHKI